jgi:hypothetical protein
MPAVVRGKRLRRFVLLLPRRADFHLLPCDTTESRATRDALPRALVASSVITLRYAIGISPSNNYQH